MSQSRISCGKWAEILLGIGGLLLLFWMIQKIGLPKILSAISQFGWKSILFLVLLYLLSQISFCAAWHILWHEEPKPDFLDTFLAYSAGDALNMTIPSGNLAGEPVKVMLIREKVSLTQALSTVTIYKFSDLLSMSLFLLLGWLLHFHFYSFPVSWNVGAGIIIFGMTTLCLLLFYLQKRGVYHPTGKWLEKMGLEKWIFSKLESAHLIDQGIRDFYVHHPRKFVASVFYNFLAWFGGVVEILLFMRLSGVETSFAAALTIETFSLFINNILFFVPARLGVGEGGRVLLFLTLGYPPSSGMSYGIIRRVRESFWIGFGFLVLLIRKRKKLTSVSL